MKLRSATAIVAVLAATALVGGAPLSANARGGGGGGRGGGGTGGKSSKDGCNGSLGSTKKHKHQPFVDYKGTITTPADQPYQHTNPWYVTIDRCKKAPKVALIQGTVPGYYCGSTAWYPEEIGYQFFGVPARSEPALTGGAFTTTAYGTGVAMNESVKVSGNLTGAVTIPKHGRGQGSGTITGTVTPTGCPGQAFPFTVKFHRTYAYLWRGTPH